MTDRTTSRSRASLVGRLHAWFESMRVDGGYGGPVSHWWRDSLRYAGPGLDWRYEGILHGYLNLYDATGDDRWLAAATEAGRDLVAGQSETGTFRASGFERNPECGGTPHEACASAALLRLARTRRAAGRAWRPYAATARRNLAWHVEALWNERDGTFSDTVGMRSYVPNKIASTLDALLRFARAETPDATAGATDATAGATNAAAIAADEATLRDTYIRPAAESIVALQVTAGPRQGAIHQLCTGSVGESNGDGKFFPLYIARCVPPLLAVADYLGDSRYSDAALAAGEFLKQVEQPPGRFPQVVYRNGRRNEKPHWVAGVGDVLRAYRRLNERGHDFGTGAVREWLRAGFDECGAFRTARGFGHLSGHAGQPVLRDVLHVCGWNDKAFRWLTETVTEVQLAEGSNAKSRHSCTFDGARGVFEETSDHLQFTPVGRRTPTYYWDKQSNWTDFPADDRGVSLDGRER